MDSEFWKMGGSTVRFALLSRSLVGAQMPGEDLRRVILPQYIEFQRAKDYIHGIEMIAARCRAPTVYLHYWKCCSCGREFVDYEGMTELKDHADKHAYGLEDR